MFKLRIQDLPEDRKDEVTELIMKHYVTEEPVHKSVGIATNPEIWKMYSDYLREILNDSKCKTVICCSDDTDEVKEIMGISLMILIKDYTDWNSEEYDAASSSEPWKKYMAMCYDMMQSFNPMAKHDLSRFYDDRALLVLPEYRGLGIAEAIFKSRRLISAANEVPMTGVWMTNYGSQIAAQRDGWEVACEINYQDFGKKHGVTFTDVPETLKFMIGRAQK